IAAGLLVPGISPFGVAAQDMPPTAAAAAPEVPTAPPPAPPAASKPDHVRVIWSQFADIPVSGDADSTLRYGGKVDAYFDLGGSNFGLDDSFTLQVHPEFKYGESANGTIGLIPTNTQLFYPGEGDVFDLNVNVTKKWKDGTTLQVGKVNVLDLATLLPIVGGGGHEGFQNLAMALPPSAIVPGSITGALFQKPTKNALYRLWVFDPESQSRRSGLEDPFSKGVAFLGSVTIPTKVAGKRGYYALKLAGSTRKSIADDALPPVLIPAPGSGFGDRRGEFSAVLAFYQYLAEYPESPGKGWGVFGQAYLSNGNPTFLDRSAFIGISGNPRGRPQDRFGVAWFRYSLTNKLVRVLGNRIALEDEEGLEAFYTVQVAKPVRLTASVQVIDSAIAVRDTGVIAGMRLTTRF
ncbi:MAG: carbohydrate porin, partial [Sphingomonadaceae bacterium]|nr:carbohydrate porin [Sphingomonadaceae bacterium]